MIGRQRTHGTQPVRNRLGDLARVPARPDTRAVDAAASAVGEHAVDDHVEIRGPVVDDVVAQQDLREARSVRLNLPVATVAIDRRLAAEYQAAIAAGKDRGA